jgi:hypothetical protein
METICKHGVDFAEYYSCKQCDSEEIAKLKEEVEYYSDCAKTCHDMLMQLRQHFGAWDTPTAPSDQDIVDCIIRNAEKKTNKYLQLLRRIRKDIVEGVYQDA